MANEVYASKTSGGRIKAMADHIHSAQFVRPTLAAGVQVTGDGAAWTLGVKAEIIAANDVASPFDIHWVNIEAASAADTYEIVLYKGLAAAEIEVGRLRFTKSAAVDLQMGVPFQMEIVPANTRISATCASASGGVNVTISVMGHTY